MTLASHMAPDDELIVQVNHRKQFSDQASATVFLEYVSSFEEFAPETVRPATDRKSRVRLSKTNKERAIETVQGLRGGKDYSGGVDLVFERDSSPRARISHNYGPAYYGFARTSSKVEATDVRDSSRLSRWVDFGVGLIRQCDGWYGNLTHDAELFDHSIVLYRTAGPDHKSERVTEPTGISGVGVQLHECIPGVFWGNYFSKFYVDWLGRNKFESLPCVELRRFDDGAVFFTTAETPFDWEKPETRKLQVAVREHLGEDAFFKMDLLRPVLDAMDYHPDGFRAQSLHPPVRVPDFPFLRDRPKNNRTPAEDIEYVKSELLRMRMKKVREEGNVVVLKDRRGGFVRITGAPDYLIEYLPKF